MEPPENRSLATQYLEDTAGGIEAAHKLIMRWDSAASEEARERMIFDGDRREVDRYLRAVDEIRRSSAESDPSGAIQIAMARLEDEFRNILVTHSSPVDTDALSDHFNSLNISFDSRAVEFGDDDEEDDDNSLDDEDPRKFRELEADRRSSSSRRSSTTSIREIDLVPSDAISDLRSIADRMIAAGYLRECIQVYGSVRKSVVDAGFRQLGIEKLTIGDVQRLEWDALEKKIRRWIRAARIGVRILFASEKLVCKRIFDGLGDDDAGDACFMEAVKGAAIQLFNFAEAVSISRRSPEKLFKILDLHDALSDLLQDVDFVFRSGSSESVRAQAAEILSRLAEAARGILSEFENMVQRDPSKIPVPGGTIHPLTRYVMNYVSLISEYRPTLTELVVSRPSAAASAPDIEFPQSEDQSALAHHMIWIIVALQSNLGSKSKLYRDDALSHLFIMNNLHYIVEKAKGSPKLRKMIGDAYLRRLTGLYRQSAMSYQRATWVRILYCLRDEGIHVTGGFASGVSKSVLKERFKNFNLAIEEAHRIQSTWSVPDPQLREELRISIAEKLLPAYRSFLGRFRHYLENNRHSEMFIKYSVEDLESALLDFFEACIVPHHISRRCH